MSSQDMQTQLDELVRSPFARLRLLLDGSPPGASPIDLSLGEPKALVPSFLGPTLQDHVGEFGRYPPIGGIPALRQAIAAWLERRYPGLKGEIDPERHLLPLSGSREGLFSAIFPARARKSHLADPAVLIPNPFYQAYAAAAAAACTEPVFLAAGAGDGFLPDLHRIDEALLARTAAFYLCTPSNPQGAVAGRSYLAKAIALARRFDFFLFTDECYSEIYHDVPPPGALETAFAETGSLTNVVSFQSLSKRSGLPGLRSGFVAGDPAFIAAFGRFRHVACPQMPLPIQHASVKVWGDERHVEEGRAAYRRNFAVADEVLQGRYGYRRPGGGFFLWLNLAVFGGGEAATKTLWKGCCVKVLPGSYLAQAEPDGTTPGADYVRIALVHDAETTREALTRVVATLG